jgi:arginase family enzyme
MKDISIYFSPLNCSELSNNQLLGGQIIKYTFGSFPQIKKGSVVVFDVPEYRGDVRKDQENYGESYRSFLYDLNIGFNWNMPIVDLGTINPGESINDTYFAVSQVVGELVKIGAIPVIIGGSQDLTVAVYKGYERLEQMVNLCSIDSKLDLGNPDEELASNGFVSHLLLQRPCFLFNHANIGLQAPFVSAQEMELFDKLYFDCCRLGEFSADHRKAEPHLRNADILSLDLTAVKSSDLMNVAYDSPNGFLSEQLCQITKYAGISDKLTSFGVFNYYPEKQKGVTSSLVAQLIWYFLDGVASRKGDFPIGSKKNYLKFTVHLDDFKDEITFYKSNKSDRWWMEVPYPPQKGVKYERHQLVPCDAIDYEKAMKNELPDLWWKTYQKLS